MTTTIECTKDELKKVLTDEFTPGFENLDDLDEAINDLVRQANNTRGTFKTYSDYLDADITAGGVRDSGTPSITRPVPTYVPTPGVKAQLDLVARACVAPVTLPMGEYLIVRIGVKADMRAQGIEMKVHELDTWIAEYVHTARENR